MFESLRELEEGSRKFNQLLNQIAIKLYYIPSMLIQKYTWSTASDELMSAGLEELCRAINRYDHHRNNNFRLYSYRAIKGRISREQKKEMEWYKIQNLSSPIEEYEDFLICEDTPENELMKRDNLRIFQKAMMELSGRSKQVLSMYLGIAGEPKSLREIAKTLGICHETARNIRDEAVLMIKGTLSAIKKF